MIVTTNEEWRTDIYDWKRGNDKTDVEILTLLNTLIDGLFDIEGIGIDYMCHEMNVRSTHSDVLKDFNLEDRCTELAFDLELMRTLLFGGKVRYERLQEHLKQNLDKYGYIRKDEQ